MAGLALGLAGRGLGMAGTAMMGTAGFAGRTLVSPGMLGSIARYSAVGMVLSSLPNPTARKQAIDRALFEANQEARNEYLQVKEKFKRDTQIAAIYRDSTYKQRIVEASFESDPTKKKHAKTMAFLNKSFEEKEEHLAKEKIDMMQKVESDWRKIASEQDKEFTERLGEGVSNWGTRWANTGRGLRHGAAQGIDALTGLIGTVTLGKLHGTNLAASADEHQKNLAGQTQSFNVGKDVKDQRIEKEDGSFIDIKNGKATVSWKDEETRAILMEQLRELKIHTKYEEHAKKVADEREKQQKIVLQEQNKARIETAERQKGMNLMSLGTDYIIQKAQLDYVRQSPFASAESKMMAAIEQERLNAETQIDKQTIAKKRELEEQDENYEEKEAINKDHSDKIAALQKNLGGDKQKFEEEKKKLEQERDQALAASDDAHRYIVSDTDKKKWDEERQTEIDKLNEKYNLEEDAKQARQKWHEDTKEERTAAIKKAGDDAVEWAKNQFAQHELQEANWAPRSLHPENPFQNQPIWTTKGWHQFSDPQAYEQSVVLDARRASQGREHAKWEKQFQQSEVERKKNDPKQQADNEEKRQIDQRRRDKETEAGKQVRKVKASDERFQQVDLESQLQKAQAGMAAMAKADMLNAAMRSPIRSGLEESFSMINDELIRVGEARRLGLDWQGNGGTGTASVAGEMVKPLIDELQRHKELLFNSVKYLEDIDRKLNGGVPARLR